VLAEEHMPLLDDVAYKRCFSAKMVRIAPSGNAPFPFWPYVDGIPTEDFQGYDCSEGSVEWIWRDDDGRFEHVLINAKEDKDVFMVIVLDLQEMNVVGHRLMDFKQEYGVRKS
jgi:hypothetical protein